MVISDHARGSDETLLERESARRRPRRDVKLAEDVLDVPRDGVLSDDERRRDLPVGLSCGDKAQDVELARAQPMRGRDRKSTRLNSSHEWNSYAVFCLKKKKQ